MKPLRVLDPEKLTLRERVALEREGFDAGVMREIVESGIRGDTAHLRFLYRNGCMSRGMFNYCMEQFSALQV